MTNPTHNVLVFLNQEIMSRHSFKSEVKLLEKLFANIILNESALLAHEVIDINKHRVLTKFSQIEKHLNLPEQKPFVFLNNKN
jgi:hypothetical protein